ncbi:DsbA family protein [Priestia filamentosa]|uniref:DsbA family protein n=1 Tax=Priestia filamentosa TaxID=1402861 RepID=UPI0039796BA8
MEYLTQQAKNIGLTFNFNDIKPTNTFDAHRLAKWAKTQGKDTNINEKLLSAHFKEAKDVGDIEILADIGEEASLNREEALKILQDKNLWAHNIREDQLEAKNIGLATFLSLLSMGNMQFQGHNQQRHFLKC